MKAKRGAVRQQPAKGKARNPQATRTTRRRVTDAGPRETRRRTDGPSRPPRPGADGQLRSRDPRGLQHGPASTPTRRPARHKTSRQAKARAKARKAKAPKLVRVPLRERLLTRIEAIDLNPRTLLARIPFVVLVIGALGVGLGVTLWLSTDAAERSYELGNARAKNQDLLQQKESLERAVLEAQAAPALAEAARNLGMIPSKDTAHLVQDASGGWQVIGTPKPAQGVALPPLNTPLPDEKPAPPPQTVERPVRLPAAPAVAPAQAPAAQEPAAAPTVPAAPVPAAPVVPTAQEPASPAPAAQQLAVPAAPGTNPEVVVRAPVEANAPAAPAAPPPAAVPVDPAPSAPAPLVQPIGPA